MMNWLKNYLELTIEKTYRIFRKMSEPNKSYFKKIVEIFLREYNKINKTSFFGTMEKVTLQNLRIYLGSTLFYTIKREINF